MKKSAYILIFLISTLSFGQKDLKKLLKQYNDKSVPYISVEELAMPKTNAILIDARELKEYNISHLQQAVYAGYNHFDLEAFQNKIPKKNTPLVVYCSLGIRSEMIADSLLKAGYTNVKNLYGGIFEWKNKDLPVYNSSEKETDSIHAFSKEWSQWLKKGIKVYD